MSRGASAEGGPAAIGGERSRSRVGRTGRRPGRGGTRERILLAARASFGERGFEGATIRDVAARAAVDPALVHHYFGSKHRLFVAAMEFPVDPSELVSGVMDGPPERAGERIVLGLLELWERPGLHPVILGMLRSATTDPVAAGMLRDLLVRGPLLALASATGRPDAELRATLAGSQIVGLLLARFVVAVEPLASAPAEVVARAIGPTIQRYLIGELEG